MRLHAIAAGILGLMIVPVAAQDAGTGRYAIEPSVDGFIRLDTETGAISHCTRRDNVWRCETLAEDRSAVEALTDQVRALGERVDALTGRLDELEGRPPVDVPPPAATEFEPEPGFAEMLVQRLILLVRDIRSERQPNS
jgi:hypothetical protein